LADGDLSKIGDICEDNFMAYSEKEIPFSSAPGGLQEGRRAGIWCAQDRFAMLTFPALTWSKYHMTDVMTTCEIMHKMIIENEREHRVIDQEP
jgi:hypothetical protein